MGEGVYVGETEGVPLRVPVAVGEPELVPETVPVGETEAVPVGELDGVGETEAVPVGELDGVGEAVPEGLAEREAVPVVEEVGEGVICSRRHPPPTSHDPTHGRQWRRRSVEMATRIPRLPWAEKRATPAPGL